MINYNEYLIEIVEWRLFLNNDLCYISLMLYICLHEQYVHICFQVSLQKAHSVVVKFSGTLGSPYMFYLITHNSSAASKTYHSQSSILSFFPLCHVSMQIEHLFKAKLKLLELPKRQSAIIK